MFEDVFLDKTIDVINKMDRMMIRNVANMLRGVRTLEGRLFIMGMGGSAANASHAVNDFRKLANIEAYSPFDNVAEMTARMNDEDWNLSLIRWLETNKLREEDVVLFLSVGGGDEKENVSMNLVNAANYAISQESLTICIVGREGGELAKVCAFSILIPMLYPEFVTPITEAMQSVILHLLVSHPLLASNPTKW